MAKLLLAGIPIGTIFKRSHFRMVCFLSVIPTFQAIGRGTTRTSGHIPTTGQSTPWGTGAMWNWTLDIRGMFTTCRTRREEDFDLTNAPSGRNIFRNWSPTQVWDKFPSWGSIYCLNSLNWKLFYKIIDSACMPAGNQFWFLWDPWFW